MIVLRLLALAGIVYLLQGCATEPVDMVLRPSPEFQPVYPLAADRQKIATGGIYSNRQSDAWFGRGRNYQVGDIITVLLNESTQAARTQNTDVSRESKNSLPSGFNTKIGKMSPFLNGVDINNNNNSSKGTGKADQQASLSGSVAVTVVEILANGNLMIRGEKKTGFVRRH
jgi:flagellar L-ring protein precursor FlgH